MTDQARENQSSGKAVDIAELRRRLGSPGEPISQAELGRRCSVAASTIWRFETKPDTQQGPLLVLLQKMDAETGEGGTPQDAVRDTAA